MKICSNTAHHTHHVGSNGDTKICVLVGMGRGEAPPPTGYLKAVWPEIFGSVFGRFSAKLGPKTPLERRGSSCSAGCTKNQPGRPILRPFRGSKKNPARLPSGTPYLQGGKEGEGEGTPPPTHQLVVQTTLCYAILLPGCPGWKSGFRAGFRPDFNRENPKISQADIAAASRHSSISNSSSSNNPRPRATVRGRAWSLRVCAALSDTAPLTGPRLWEVSEHPKTYKNAAARPPQAVAQGLVQQLGGGPGPCLFANLFRGSSSTNSSISKRQEATGRRQPEGSRQT
jgi:hypothetical protein